MKLVLATLLISSSVFSISHPPNETKPVHAISRVSEAACIRSYSKKEYVACIKLVDSAILKAYWVGKLNQFCNSKLNKTGEKEKQCSEVALITDTLNEMGDNYLEE
ncbi:hypothetical protein [Yersinia canariae]|uniref:hypothetical protein n=1 Tax=Yersinia canariae TaxID=2607663 RepID=UPI0011A62168|nr:hypothetical protein [Yersinia canariae]